MSTIAAASAATGDFESAIQTQTAALEKATALGDPAMIEQQQEYLDAYQAGQPWRATPGSN